MENKYIVTDHGVIADAPQLQTAAIQQVLDLCKPDGGTVVFPRGKYRTAALRMWSDTTIYLCDGAILEGSDECTDYEVIPVPEGVQMRSDMEMITAYYGKPWPEYRRAILSAYGEKNIAIIGEGPDSVIDGVHCYDPDGEEHYRGPHCVYITNCENVTLDNYTCRYAGNFMHHMDMCKNIIMRRVICLAGSDGVHMHFCDNSLIEDCVFKTGDDCFGGINVTNLTVRRCEFNSSCSIFRLGGSHVLIEDCKMYGPGYYPHRMTVVKGKNNELPREQGRHNLENMFLHFASIDYPADEPYHDIVIRNCTVDYADNLLCYRADDHVLFTGTHLAEITFENVTVTNLAREVWCKADPDEPLIVHLKNVTYTYRDGVERPLFREDSLFTTVTGDAF